MQEIMKSHVSHKQFTPELIKRTLLNYIEELDPSKTYFIEPDIHLWIQPSQEQLDQILTAYNAGDFSTFSEITDRMVEAIHRRSSLECQINLAELPMHVRIKSFKDMKWATTPEELLDQLRKIRALQIEASTQLSEELRDKALQRVKKSQLKREQEILNSDSVHRNSFILSTFLKAATAALDSHTAYFTPDEAKQFMFIVQQRLFGIGAQLRDDLNGFTIVKFVEGSPAAIDKELRVKDRIIAVNGEPVVGMEINDAVELIRGKENTYVMLTVIREHKEGEAIREEKLEINARRGAVVVQEARLESSYEPFGDGVIGYIKLHSFYQDPDSSSGKDLSKALKNLKKEHGVKGIILDLRYNTGGLLEQAVDVASLFISKGVIVSIKDHNGSIQRLRHLDNNVVWDGPLIILVNRLSASSAEIVAQTLQDYGRALIVGDDHTFGKGSFQTFTLNGLTSHMHVNPEGEYKVTRGKYYTVQGTTPQLTGVISDIVVPGALSESEIGERYAKYPLENDQIKPSFNDDLSDVPPVQRDKFKFLYKFDTQKKLNTYAPYLNLLIAHSACRIETDKTYHSFLKILKQQNEEIDEEMETITFRDIQLAETYAIMKDLLFLMHEGIDITNSENFLEKSGNSR
jgi:carboxyl-terminal processing protease